MRSRPSARSEPKPNVTAGQTYFIVVDGGYDNEEGTFSLKVDFQPAPDNDTCATATPVSCA